jgi:methylornithine synthase
MLTQKYDLIQLLFELENGCEITRKEIKYLLGLSEPAEINLLFEAAQHVRAYQFGNKVFLYGFLYFSTFCKNNCRFCQYRQSNKMIPRYRKSEKEILAAAAELANAGVHLIDLTMGEDPQFLFAGWAWFSRSDHHDTKGPAEDRASPDDLFGVAA